MRTNIVVLVIAALLCAPTFAMGSPQDPPAAPAAAAPAPQDNAGTTTGDAKPLPPLITPQPQQDTFNDADQDVGTDVPVSFTDNFVSDRLPFDVPFNITGTAETAVKRIDLTVYRVSAREDLANLITYLQKTVDCVGTRPPVPGTRPPGRQVSKSSATPGTGGQFKAFVNALDPQYFYALCFVGVIPVDNSEINVRLREIIAGALARFDSEDDISDEMVIAVRQWMRQQIADIGARRPARAIIPPGNLFDEEPSTRNDAKLADNAADMLDAFRNANIGLRDYTDAIRQLVTRAGNAGAAVTGITLPTDSTLPGIETAVSENEPFAFNAFTFDEARRQLTAAIARSSGADVTNLRAVSDAVVDLAGIARLYGRRYDALRTAVLALVNEVVLEARNVDVALGSSALGADLNRAAYVSLDAGIAYPWRLESMVFYAGTNIYFRPINKKANLRYKGTFLHRFALTVGITTTVTDESRRATDLRATPDDDDESSNSLLLGGGIRVTPSIRVGAGVLVFKESDPNPLIDQTSVAVTPYVAFTADINVAQLFKSFF